MNPFHIWTCSAQKKSKLFKFEHVKIVFFIYQIDGKQNKCIYIDYTGDSCLFDLLEKNKLNF